jgi:hypothetical protein
VETGQQEGIKHGLGLSGGRGKRVKKRLYFLECCGRFVAVDMTRLYSLTSTQSIEAEQILVKC